MNGVLWVLRTGAPRHDLPSRYPPYQTCDRRFQLWPVASASPYEPRLGRATLAARFLPDLRWCLIGDRGYDSDGLDDLLMTQYGLETIAANRRGRAKTQDGRPLRRAKRRWKIERLFAWLHNCRRVVTRWDRHVGNYLGWCISPVPGSCSGHLCDLFSVRAAGLAGDWRPVALRMP